MRVSKMPEPGETLHADGFEVEHGGKGSNQAVAMARLGASVSFLSAVGRDAYGDSAFTLWKAEGVDASAVEVAGDSTMVGLILVEPNGENRIAIASGALDALDAESVTAFADPIAAADLVVISMEIPVEAVESAVFAAHAAGTRVLVNPAPAKMLSDDALRKIDFITPNESEARILLGLSADATADDEDLARQIQAKTGGTVVLTQGAHGSLVAHADGTTASVAAVTADEVVDTTGAGDSFTAALAVALAEGSNITDAAEFAARAGSFTVQHAGVVRSLPFRADLDKTQAGADS